MRSRAQRAYFGVERAVPAPGAPRNARPVQRRVGEVEEQNTHGRDEEVQRHRRDDGGIAVPADNRRPNPRLVHNFPCPLIFLSRRDKRRNVSTR